MSQEKEVADRITSLNLVERLEQRANYEENGGVAEKMLFDTAALLREAAAALRTAREEGYRQGVDDAAKVVAEACAGWLAQFEGGTITYVSASTYAADAVRDVADVARNRLLALTPSSAPAEPGGKR